MVLERLCQRKGEGRGSMMRRSTVLLSATLGLGLLYLAATLVLGSPPGGNRQRPDDRGMVPTPPRRGADLGLAADPGRTLFAVFAALVRAELPSPYADVFFFGAIALAAETAVYGWLWLGMS